MEEELPDLGLGQTLRSFASGQKVFGRYTLARILGRGGMGVVWLARDEQLEVDVALKFLPELLALDPGAIDDMKRETRRSRELSHRNIVKVYHFEQAQELAAISMEHVDGESLAKLKVDQAGKCFSHTQLGPWLLELADALDYAHSEAKMVHRDLKPANVMLDNRGRTKITDFGIASSIADSVSQLSVGRGSSGTPPYMSPQQAAGRTAQRVDDIYSLGATIYDLMTGKPPFYSGNIHHQVENIVPPSMAERRTALGNSAEPIPDTWEQTIAACLAKDPAQRPQSAREVAQRLGLTVPQYGHGTTASGPAIAATTTPLTVTAPKPAKRKLVVVAAMVVLALIGGASGWYLGLHVPRETARKAEEARLAAQHNESEAKAPAAEQRQKEQKNKAETDRQLAITEQQRMESERKATADAEAEKERLATVQRAKEEEAKKAAQLKIAAATKAQPYENSLGMKFVPVPGTKVLFSIWDTRVRDFRAYAEATNYRQRGGIEVMKLIKNKKGSSSTKWEMDSNASWEEPGFSQSAEHPVVGVSWEEAKAFCAWLTESERKVGRIGDNQEYRLPTDAEWSAAVGESKYPWGNKWPPPEGAGNYFDDAAVAKLPGKGWSQVPGNDGFARTSPVGSFKPNPFGLYDVGGNVWQWCEDWYRKEMNEKAVLNKYPALKDDGGGEKYRVVRGASWGKREAEALLSS